MRVSSIFSLFCLDVWLCGRTIGPRPCYRAEKCSVSQLLVHSTRPAMLSTCFSIFLGAWWVESTLTSYNPITHFVTYFLFSCGVRFYRYFKAGVIWGLGNKFSAANLSVFSFYDNAPRSRGEVASESNMRAAKRLIHMQVWIRSEDFRGFRVLGGCSCNIGRTASIDHVEVLHERSIKQCTFWGKTFVCCSNI